MKVKVFDMIIKVNFIVEDNFLMVEMIQAQNNPILVKVLLISQRKFVKLILSLCSLTVKS